MESPDLSAPAAGSGAEHRVTWNVDAHFGGLVSMLADGHFSDITIELPDGQTICAHRVLLAAASDVLKAKFASDFLDSAERSWRPDVGSARAWQWLVSWIYGNPTPLPPDLFVELLVLGDHLQIRALVQGITSLPIGCMAGDVAIQILDVWACPDILTMFAEKCVPQVNIEPSMLSHLRAAHIPNLALFIKHMPVIHEGERLKLIGASLNSPDRFHSLFYDYLIDSVHWDMFPADILETSIFGDLKYFEKLLGQPITFSEETRKAMVKALALRCRRWEQQFPALYTDFLLWPHIPLPEAPSNGLFSLLVDTGHAPEVFLSSAHLCKGSKSDSLFSLSTLKFSVIEQSSSHEPSIEVKLTSNFCINPEGVGLRHGWEERDFSQAFVVEAKGKDDVWHTLLNCSSTGLDTDGALFQVPQDAVAGKYFQSFRIRMTGRTSSGTWYLMVEWFEIFGKVSTDLWNLFDESEQMIPL